MSKLAGRLCQNAPQSFNLSMEREPSFRFWTTNNRNIIQNHCQQDAKSLCPTTNKLWIFRQVSIGCNKYSCHDFEWDDLSYYHKRRIRVSNTNTLLFNQSCIDIFSILASVPTFIISSYWTKFNGIWSTFICTLSCCHCLAYLLWRWNGYGALGNHYIIVPYSVLECCS